MEKMNLVLLIAFVALVNPTTSISHNNDVNYNYNYDNNNNNNHDQSDYNYYYYAKPPNSILSLPPRGSDLPPSPSPPGDGFLRCPRLLRTDVIARTIKHMKGPAPIKAILSRSVKFADCVTSNSCHCFMLRFAPLIDACLALIGGICLEGIASNDPILNCTIDCVNSSINNNQQLDDGAIGDACYGKCMKSA